MQQMEWIEEDLQEIVEIAPDATTIQLLSATPLCMTYDFPEWHSWQRA